MFLTLSWLLDSSSSHNPVSTCIDLRQGTGLGRRLPCCRRRFFLAFLVTVSHATIHTITHDSRRTCSSLCGSERPRRRPCTHLPSVVSLIGSYLPHMPLAINPRGAVDVVVAMHSQPRINEQQQRWRFMTTFFPDRFRRRFSVLWNVQSGVSLEVILQTSFGTWTDWKRSHSFARSCIHSSVSASAGPLMALSECTPMGRPRIRAGTLTRTMETSLSSITPIQCGNALGMARCSS